MRRTIQIIGPLIALTGCVWTLQGIGLLRGSPMTGESFWMFAGLVLLPIGISITYIGRRPSGR